MGALSRFSDSLEEMEPSCPHPGGHRDASRATGRPFPCLEDCALLADPSWGGCCFQANSTFPPSREHLPCPSQHGDVCVCVTPTPIPSPSQLLEYCHVFQTFYSSLLTCPGQDCKLRCSFKERKQVLPSTPNTCTSVTFPVGPMGKDQWEEWLVPAGAVHCLDVCIPNSCQSVHGQRPQQKMSRRPSLQEGQLPPFLPQGILSDKDERRNWVNSPTPPVKTSTTPS